MKTASEALENKSPTAEPAMDAICRASMAQTHVIDSYEIPLVEIEQKQLKPHLDGAISI